MEPITKYSIKTLSSEDYDSLPYLHARESAGLTDRFLKVAYIRDTGDVSYDTDTLMHEIEEMTTDKWSHEDKYGVRYKSWFQKTFVPESKSSIGSILGTLGSVALAPFTGGASLAYMPLTGAIGGAIGGSQEGGGIGSTLMGGLKGFGLGSVGSGINAAVGGAASGLKGNVGEFIQGVQQPSNTVGSWVNKLTSGLTGAAPKTGSLSTFGVGGLKEGASNAIGSMTSEFAPTSSGSGLMSQGFNKAMSSNPSLNLLGASGAVNAALKNMSATPSDSPSGLNSFNQPAQKSGLSSLQKFGLGTALTGLGQSAKTPEMPQSRFTQMMVEGGLQPRTAIGQQAMAKASELLAQNPQGLSEDYKNAILADFDKQDAEEERVLKQTYKSLRPYADVENDSAYNKDLTDLKQEQQEYRKNTLAKLEQANEESNKSYQRQDIINAMGIDEQTFNEYASLANQDLNTIMMQTGLDYGKATQFQEMFGKLGGELISSSLGLDNSGLDNFKVYAG